MFLNSKYAKTSFTGVTEDRNAKSFVPEFNFAAFAWIYPAQQGFANFTVNGFKTILMSVYP